MKYIIRTIQYVVGVLFIVSGLVKANDPLGLSYKMQEFFELWTGSLRSGHFFIRSGLVRLLDVLHDHSLALAIFMIVLEIITGVALVLGWRKKMILSVLLPLMVFFTFLTGYAYLSGKFTNCGCFGDCLPITPITSFSKDVILLVLILLLIAGRSFIHTVTNGTIALRILLLSLLISIGIQWYVLNYLPLADCLPFKRGNNISTEMKPPPNSVPDSFAIKFIYEKMGKRYEFSPENLPADFNSYKFIDRKQELIRKGNAEPAIKGFSLTGITGEDSTAEVLQEPNAILFFLQYYQNPDAWLSGLKTLVNDSHQKNIPVYIITSDIAGVQKVLAINHINCEVFTCDFTVIRTAARTNPTVYIIKQGTIIDKFGLRNIGAADKEIMNLN